MSTAYVVQKECRKCGVLQDAGQFSLTSTGSLYSYCTTCNTARARRWREAHPESWRPGARYNIDFDALWATQNGQCAICGHSMRRGGKAADSVVVDHDGRCCPRNRSCGRCVRGLVHAACNQMIGLAYESIDTLVGAVAYLKRWQERPIESDSGAKRVCGHCGAVGIGDRLRCCPAMRDDRRAAQERENRSTNKACDAVRNARRRKAGCCYVCAKPIGRSGQCDECNAHRREVRRAREGVRPRDATAIAAKAWMTRRKNTARKLILLFDTAAYAKHEAVEHAGWGPAGLVDAIRQQLKEVP